MDLELFKVFSELIEREAGIHLTKEKISLLSNRIQKRLRALKLSTEADYLEYVRHDKTGEELVNMIDVVSTNVTYFYREEQHFGVLKEILQEYAESGKTKVKIWCAASSSGEEPYTLAIVAKEALKGKKCDVKILATDICTKVLHKAIAGRYEPKQLEKAPRDVVAKYFEHEVVDEEPSWVVKPEIKDKVLYKKLNLAEFPYPLRGPVDIVFCRNVMIYFDIPLRQRIISEFERLLVPGGFLFLSHSENLLGITHNFDPYAVSVFRKR